MPFQGNYHEYIDLYNEAAKLNGFSDASMMKVDPYESKTFIQEMEDTWQVKICLTPTQFNGDQLMKCIFRGCCLRPSAAYCHDEKKPQMGRFITGSLDCRNPKLVLSLAAPESSHADPS